MNFSLTFISKEFLNVSALSIEKCAKVTHAITSELVSRYGDKDLVFCQILINPAAGRLFVSIQLSVELPLPS